MKSTLTEIGRALMQLPDYSLTFRIDSSRETGFYVDAALTDPRGAVRTIVNAPVGDREIETIVMEMIFNEIDRVNGRR